MIILGIPLTVAANSTLTGNNGINVTSGGDATIAGTLSGGAGSANLNAAGAMMVAGGSVAGATGVTIVGVN
ncbi:hypothetical protein, partial [Sphingomonas sp. 10B4]|uniref:hypothetical protein n=1 Tax=Sphingomonas sp. 10B4 TaxID=3048575 RepID=UPI002B23BB03